MSSDSRLPGVVHRAAFGLCIFFTSSARSSDSVNISHYSNHNSFLQQQQLQLQNHHEQNYLVGHLNPSKEEDISVVTTDTDIRNSNISSDIAHNNVNDWEYGDDRVTKSVLSSSIELPDRYVDQVQLELRHSLQHQRKHQ